MPHQAKVDSICQMRPPTDVSKLRTFVGLVNYYRTYVEHFSRIARPLYDLLKKDVHWEWTTQQQQPFEELKAKLMSMPVMKRPDFCKPFILHTDWSALGIGAILAQQDEGGGEQVVVYASRSNNWAESNYSSYKGECLAVVWAVVHFRPYLFGKPFTLYTDHQPLHWLMTNDKLTGKHESFVGTASSQG